MAKQGKLASPQDSQGEGFNQDLDQQKLSQMLHEKLSSAQNSELKKAETSSEAYRR